MMDGVIAGTDDGQRRWGAGEQAVVAAAEDKNITFTLVYIHTVSSKSQK